MEPGEQLRQGSTALSVETLVMFESGRQTDEEGGRVGQREKEQKRYSGQVNINRHMLKLSSSCL